MELAIGSKVPVSWHIGSNLYDPAGGVFHPGTVAVGRLDGSTVNAGFSFSEGRGAILIAQPTAGPWGAGLIDAVGALVGHGGSSHMWMSPSICEGGSERWVLAMGRASLNLVGEDLLSVPTYSPYHQEGATPGYGGVRYGDDGREPRFFKTETFADKTAGSISMLLVELVQYISDNKLSANDAYPVASGAYPAFSRTLGGASTASAYAANARNWCANNSIAIINDYLTGCGASSRFGDETTTTTTAATTTTTTAAATTTTTTAAPTTTTTTTTAATTTTTTAAPTTTTTTAAPTTTTTTTAAAADPCVCYTLTNTGNSPIYDFQYTTCDDLYGTVDILKNSSARICVRRANDIPGHPDLAVTTSNEPCARNAQTNEFECCPLYDIGYVGGSEIRFFTIGCIQQPSLLTLVVSHSSSGTLILGRDYTIRFNATTGCLEVSLTDSPHTAMPGTYTFVINGCTYTKVLTEI